MRSWYRYLVGAFGLAISGGAYAAWSSGGGELIRDGNNPWFLANTQSASYCIQIAPQGFPFDADKMQIMLTELFAYWKGEFAKGEPPYALAKVATQNFYRAECTDTTDIKFQFGFMTPAQMKVIANPTDYISLAVRTDYDAVNLRGRGFVYVAAEQGPFRPAGDKIIDLPWQACDGCRLKRVLAHELGHVFGIPHITTGSLINLMAPETPENLVRKDFPWNRLGPNTPLPYFFAHNQEFSYKFCSNHEFDFKTQQRFFSVQDSMKCLQFRRVKGQYELLAAGSAPGDFHSIGRFEVHSGSSAGPDVVRVRLTAAQAVFPAYTLRWPYVGAGQMESTEDEATFIPLGSGEPRSVLIRVGPSGVEVDGFMDNDLQYKILWGSSPY